MGLPEIDPAAICLTRSLNIAQRLHGGNPQRGHAERRLSRSLAFHRHTAHPGGDREWGHAHWTPCKNMDVTKYAVVIHEEAEGGFWAEVPALPGCYSQGDSIAELTDNVREAIAGVLEVMPSPE